MVEFREFNPGEYVNENVSEIEGLADQNLGFINLGLLILFFVAIYKVVKFGKLSSVTPKNLADSSPLRPEIDREIKVEDEEKGLITGQVEKMTKIELRTVEDIAKALSEIERILETHRNNLPREERERIGHILTQISKDEEIFKRSVRNLQKLFQRLDIVDAKHFSELKENVVQHVLKIFLMGLVF